MGLMRQTKGKTLDRIAEYGYGVFRRQAPWWWPWWPLRESDKQLRKRILKHYEIPSATTHLVNRAQEVIWHVVVRAYLMRKFIGCDTKGRK